MSVDPPGLTFERQFIASGCVFVAGLDEAGRGAWAGPVSAGAVILPLRDPTLPDHLESVRDSKLCSPTRREVAYLEITGVALAWAVGWASAAEIDEEGIVPATRLAMRRAIDSLALKPAALLIDGSNMHLHNVSQPQQTMNKGERQSLSIAAASIIAKVSRDRLLIEMDSSLPGYGFCRHKGYGTKEHRAAITTLGLTPEHRCSFAPIRRRLLEDF